MESKFDSLFMLLTKMAYDSRLALPMCLSVAFMVLNFRWEIEINIHTERVIFQHEDPEEDASSEDSWETLSDADENGDMPIGLNDLFPSP